MVCYIQYIIIIDNGGEKTPAGEIPKWLNSYGYSNSGFSLQSESECVTNGISMWSEVFLINRNGEKMYVSLLDSQVIHDNDNVKDMDRYIFGMSTFLSSFQVFNDNSYLNVRFFDLLSSFSP